MDSGYTDRGSVEDSIEEAWGAAGLSSNRGVPLEVQKVLNTAFARIPVSSFPPPPSGRVIEISSQANILEAVQILSSNKILSAPVRDMSVTSDDATWSERYLGMVDFPAIVLWVLEQAEIAAAALTAGTAAVSGMSAGAVGVVGATALGMTGPGAVMGLTAAAVGAALVGAAATERGRGKDPQSAADSLGEDFYRMLLQEEPYSSTRVADITSSYRWAPFIPIQPDDSMLTVLLLLCKMRMRSIPVIRMGQPQVVNVITQSGVMRGLAECNGFDWFDLIAQRTLLELGLPLMAPLDVVFVDEEKLVLEAFVLMREKGIGGLPVVSGQERKLVASLSVRDVRFLLLQPELFNQRKHLTVKGFVKIVTSYAARPSEPSATIQPPLTCQETSSLLEVIQVLANVGAYRIQVVNEQQELRGIITLRDIISCFVTEPQNYFDNYLGALVGGPKPT